MKIHENYLAAVAYLTEHPNEIGRAWNNPKYHPCGILFGYIGQDRYDMSYGCLTQIRSNSSTYSAATTATENAIGDDVRIPTNSIRPGDLMVFAEWQQRLDDELGREPPPVIPTFFSECDRISDDYFDWPFCYWHGAAEQLIERRIGDRYSPAPDIAECDSPMPTEPGEYPCLLYGDPAVMVLAYTHGRNFLCGRGYLVNDPKPENIRHCKSPDEWR